MVNPRNKPKFKRWMSDSYSRIKESWRNPRGIHSKVKRKEKSKVKMPLIGYRAPRSMRYLHPSGMREVLVHRAKDLEKISKDKEAVKIASAVGRKKRLEIIKKAEELKVKVLNPKK